MPLGLNGMNDRFRLGFGGQDSNEIAPFMPSQEEVAAQYEKQNEPGLIWKILVIPERLLGGQMIKGALRGYAEGGVTGALEEGFRNNPVFQILDALPGVNIVHDTSFVDIRKAFGDQNAEDGVANFFLNTAGEILTSPLELLWSPFAKFNAVAKEGALGFKAVKMAEEAGKTAETFLNAVTKDGPIKRALWSFKVPWTQTGFIFQTPYSMDVPVARSVDWVVKWLNTNPAAVGFMNMFRRAGLASGDPAERAAFEMAKDAGQYDREKYMAVFMPMIEKLMREHRYVDKESQLAITLMLEHGITGVDDAGKIVNALSEGSDVAKAHGRLFQAMSDPEFASQVGALESAAKAPMAHPDFLEQVAAFQKEHPDKALPQTVVSALRKSDSLKTLLRENVDIFGYEAKRYATKAARTDALLKDATIVPGSERSALGGRAAFTDNGPGAVAQSSIDFRASMMDLIQGIVDTKGEDYLTKLSASAGAFAKVIEGIGMADKSAGFIRQLSEFAVPRQLSQGVRDAIDAQASKFVKGKKITEMTLLEANMYALEHGYKVTNYRPIGWLSEGASEGEDVASVWSKIFDSKFIKGLKKQAKTTGDESFLAAAEFFQTNPYVMLRDRIYAAGALRERQGVMKGIFNTDGPFVQAVQDDMADVKAIADNVNQGNVGYYVPRGKDGEVMPEVFGKTANAPELYMDGLKANDRARFVVAEKQTRGFFRSAIDKAERGVEVPGAIPGMAGKRSSSAFQRAIDDLEMLANLTHDDVVKNPELFAYFRDHPLAKNLESQVEIMTRGPVVSDVGNALKGYEDSLAARIAAVKEHLSTVATNEAERVKALKTARSVLRQSRDTLAEIGSRTRMAVPTDAGGLVGLEELIAQLEGKAPKKTWSAVTGKGEQAVSDVLGQVENAATARPVKEISPEMTKLLDDLEKEGARYPKLKDRFNAQRIKELEKQQADELRVLRDQADSHRSIIRTQASEYRQMRKARVDAMKSARGGIVDKLRDVALEDHTEAAVLDEIKQHLIAADNGGVLPMEALRQQEPALWEKLSKQTNKGRIYWMTKDHADKLLGPDGAVSQLFEPSKFREMFKFMDEGNTIWKAITVLPPVYAKSRLRDFASSMMMLFGYGGAPVQHYFSVQKDVSKILSLMDVFKPGAKPAAQLLREGFESPKLAQYLDLGKWKGTVGEFITEMQGHGILGSGLVRQDLELMGEDALRNIPGHTEGNFIKAFRKKVTDNGFMEYGGKIIEGVDDHVKLSGVLAHLKSGKDLEEAVAAVKPWIYDPRRVDMSNFERDVLRRFIPMYTFTKQSSKIALQAFLAKPATSTWMEKVRTNIKAASGMDELQFNTFMPEFIRDNMGVPTEKTEDGFKVKMFGSMLPSSDVIKLAQAMADTVKGEGKGGVLDFMGEKLTPFVKVPLEKVMNRSFFTQGKIERYAGEKVEFMGVPMSPTQREMLRSVRILNELDHLNIFSLKDVRVMLGDAGAVERTRQGDLTLGDRFSGTVFSPSPFGREYAVKASARAKVLKGEQDLAVGGLKHQMRIQAQFGDSSTKDENLSTLRQLVAAEMAKIQARQAVESRFNIHTR